MKTSLIAFASLAILLGSGCKTQTNEQKSDRIHLDRFVGTWRAAYNINHDTGFSTSTGTEITVEQRAADTVAFQRSATPKTEGEDGETYPETTFEVSLKQVEPDKCLLNLKVNSKVAATDLPLSYSESEGFRGQQAVTVDGQQRSITATIKKEGAGYIWKIGSEGGNLFEFQLKEKKD